MQEKSNEIKKFVPNRKLKLMDQVRQVLRYHHYAYKTERAYTAWIIRFIKFHNKKHPAEMSKTEIEAFLSHLATRVEVAASTQRQALNAIYFLYDKVLLQDFHGEIAPTRARRHPRPPTVMSQKEVRRVLMEMAGVHALMARLLYGCGLRLMECIRLRVQDIDFERKKIYVRDGKGGKDRVTLFPAELQELLQVHVEKVQKVHQRDLNEGYGEVYLPHALSRKYPGAAKELGWQFVFPSKKRSIDPRSGKEMRHHVQSSGLQKAVKRAVQEAGIAKRIGCHTFRHSFATHLLENGVNIRVVQELMGHADVKTTEIYTHVMEKDISAVCSPLDILAKKGNERL